jgi:starch-binding outer membrane protein, SusD/RagB family
MKKVLLLGKLVVLALCLVPMNSCTDLDEKLYDQVPESDFFRNEGEVKNAVAHVYSTLYGLMNHGSYFSTQEVNSNEVLIPQRGGDWEDGRQWIKTHLHTQNGTEDCYRNAWSFLFTGVANCNWAIYNINQASSKGNIDAAKAKTYIAEIRGLRALYYYWLLDSFGNVPISDVYPAPAGVLPTPSTRAEVYAFVESELNAASADLGRDIVYGRFNYYAAQALLSKLYLNAAVYKGSAEWAKASAAAQNVIAGNKYSLAATYRDNFKTNNETSPEMIFAIPYDKVFAQGFNLPQMTLHYESQKTFNLQEQPWNGYCTATDFYNSYDNADVRKTNNFLAGPQFAADGTTRLNDGNAEATDPDGAPLTFTPEVNAIEPNALRQAGARIAKYEFEIGGTRNLSNDFPILRYTDILLVKAEADARAAGNWSGAVAVVDQIRTRAGLGSIGSISADGSEFLAERSREVFYEGWRRQDLIRFGKFNDARGLRPNSSDAKRILWPIPTSQINANPNLKQNDGY